MKHTYSKIIGLYSPKILILWLLFLLSACSPGKNNGKNSIDATTIGESKDSGNNTRIFTDALNRSVTVPQQPKRIVSLVDITLTLPLLEINAAVIASHGRLNKDGSKYMWGVREVLNQDFENSQVQYIGGYDNIDLELIASLQPDLIVGRKFQEELLPKLEKIAPTALFDGSADPITLYAQLADISARVSTFEKYQKSYQQQIAQAKKQLSRSGLKYSVLRGNRGKIKLFANYAPLTLVLNDLGFEPSELTKYVLQNNPDQDSGQSWGAYISSERIVDDNPDFIFAGYSFMEGSPAKAQGRFSEALPDFCTFITACQAGNLIYLPEEHIGAISFRTMELSIHYAVSSVESRILQ